MANTGPSDVEVNKERLLITKDEYRRLCYIMKKHEVNRNNKRARMQQELRKQWELINKLQSKKSELMLKDRIQDTESLSSKGTANINRFELALTKLIKLEDQVSYQKEKLDKVKKEIAEEDKKLRYKQKEIVKVHRIQDRVQQHQKNINFLQNRLSSSLSRYDQLLVANSILREDINSILLTQNKFRKKYSYIKRLLSLGKKTVTEVVHAATVAYQTRETAKYKLNVIKERTQVDRKKLGEKIKDLKYMLERDQQLSDFINLKSKEREGFKQRQELALKTEQEFEQRMQLYHGTLARIQSASALKDVNQICKTFVLQEEANLALFHKVNEMNLEIERMHEEVRAQRQELDVISRQYKEQKRKDLAVKTDIVNDTDKIRHTAHNLETLTDRHTEDLEEVKNIVQRICDLIDQALESTEDLIDADEGITDDNILRCLEAYEKRIIDLIHCQKFLDYKGYDALTSESLSHKTRKSSKSRRISSATESVFSFHKSDSGKFTMKHYEKDPDVQINYNREGLDAFAQRTKERRKSRPADMSR